ncbi:MAG: glycosyltransferase family 4 protein [bacterium]|nr:glycosyltransferase family 4 protein [bacterium]
MTSHRNTTDRVRVVALTGGRNVPSARFRVEQLVPALERDGVDVDLRIGRVSSYPPRARWLRPLWLPAAILARVPDIAATHSGQVRGRVTLLQREFVSTLTTLEWATAGPRVLDVDDAIWLHRGGGAAAGLAHACDVVVAGNSYLAAWFAGHCDRVEVLPTAVDTARFAPAAPDVAHGRAPAVGWIGTATNAAFLIAWSDGLRGLLEQRPDLRLRICADRPPRLDGLPADRIDWVPWSPAAEVPFLHSLDLGLMPLPDTPWTRGKCAFKMLQYLACGIPAVVSPVGMNAEVLEQAAVGRAAGDGEEAAHAIGHLLDDAAGRAAMGAAGRQLVEDRYSVAAVAPQLASILRAVAFRG